VPSPAPLWEGGHRPPNKLFHGGHLLAKTLADACREQADLAEHHRPSAQSIPVPNRGEGFIAGAPPLYMALPPGDADFLKRWGLIKAGFSKQACALFRQEAWINPSKARHRESTLWMSSIGRIGTAHPQRVYRIPVRVGGSNLKSRESPASQHTD
jgi:hypothetical protein